jgi:hypothetical protein
MLYPNEATPIYAPIEEKIYLFVLRSKEEKLSVNPP